MMTFTALFLIMTFRYFLLSGLFYWFIKNSSLPAITEGQVQNHQIKRDIYYSVLSSLVFALSGALIVRLWEMGQLKIYLAINSLPLWYLPLSLIIYLFLQDTYFYWTHRWMHKFYFKQMHFAHHESKIPSAWTSFAFHPWEALVQALILPLLLLMIPVHLGVLILALIIMSVFGITNHLGREIYPLGVFKKLSVITATHHQIHHHKMNYNFGLYFSWWDKWMRTEHP